MKTTTFLRDQRRQLSNPFSSKGKINYLKFVQKVRGEEENRGGARGEIRPPAPLSLSACLRTDIRFHSLPNRIKCPSLQETSAVCAPTHTPPTPLYRYEPLCFKAIARISAWPDRRPGCAVALQTVWAVRGRGETCHHDRFITSANRDTATAGSVAAYKPGKHKRAACTQSLLFPSLIPRQLNTVSCDWAVAPFQLRYDDVIEGEFQVLAMAIPSASVRCRHDSTVAMGFKRAT